MITINGKYKIPSEWLELRPYQYLKICEAVTDFLRGKKDFEAFKLQVLMILLDIESKKIKNLSETFCEKQIDVSSCMKSSLQHSNMFVLSKNQFGFYIHKVKYPY